MKVKDYVENQINRFGIEQAKINLQKAMYHHKYQYKIHKADVCLTTSKFFENCLNEINK